MNKLIVAHSLCKYVLDGFYCKNEVFNGCVLGKTDNDINSFKNT